MPRHIVCLTFDFDTQSGFIARGMTTPTPLSRGEFGAMASGRILKFLKDRGIKATWFTPGFTIESHPRACEAVVAGGHEVAHHSWAHVPPAQQSKAEEEADLVRANETDREHEVWLYHLGLVVERTRLPTNALGILLRAEIRKAQHVIDLIAAGIARIQPQNLMTVFDGPLVLTHYSFQPCKTPEHKHIVGIHLVGALSIRERRGIAI